MTIATAALVLAGVGTAVSAIGAVRQGQAASAAADYNAQVARQNAVVASQQAAQQAALQQRQARQRIGAARAAYGAAGVRVEGSPLDVLESSAANAELDRQTILYRGQLRALGYNDTAALNEAQGANAEQQGYLRAGSALLLGGAQTFAMIPQGGGGGSILNENPSGSFMPADI